MKLKFPLVIDVAYNNHIKNHPSQAPDWSRLNPLPDGIICKASEALFEDPLFGQNWLNLGEHSIPRMAYHFYRSNYSSGAQAKFFVNTINKYGGMKPGDCLIMDAEEEGIMSASAIADFLYNVNWLTRTGCILYSRPLILNALSFKKLNAAQKQLFKDTPIWSSSTFDNNDTADRFDSPYQYKYVIPDQSRYGKVILWQYAIDTDPLGLIENVPGGLDFNWIDPGFFVGWKEATDSQPIPIPTPEPPPITSEEHTVLMDGVTYIKHRAYDSWVHVLLIDPTRRKIIIPDWRMETDEQTAQRTGARLILNGGPHNETNGKPKGLFATAGLVRVLRQTFPRKSYDYSPWLNITKDNRVQINKFDSREKPYYALSGFQMLLDKGRKPQTSASWNMTEPRSILGVRADGTFVAIAVDGRLPDSKGITLHEGYQLALDWNCLDAANFDGGKSVSRWFDGKLLNEPCEGEIKVGTHIGVL